MAIEFLEDRQLLSGELVKKGDIRTFEPDEEAAFIDNGVAKKVTTKAAAKEVSANG